MEVDIVSFSITSALYTSWFVVAVVKSAMPHKALKVLYILVTPSASFPVTLLIAPFISASDDF